MKPAPHIFKKSISALLFSIVACLFYFQQSDKPKNYYSKVTGTLVSVENYNDNYPGNDTLKFRYLLIDNYPKPFELYIGKGAGDFKPKFENIDNLKIGDILTIYFSESYKTQRRPVNNRVFFIDKGQVPFFIEGNSKKNLIYGIIAFCAVFILIIIILKVSGKIV